MLEEALAGGEAQLAADVVELGLLRLVVHGKPLLRYTSEGDYRALLVDAELTLASPEAYALSDAPYGVRHVVEAQLVERLVESRERVDDLSDDPAVDRQARFRGGDTGAGADAGLLWRGSGARASQGEHALIGEAIEDASAPRVARDGFVMRQLVEIEARLLPELERQFRGLGPWARGTYGGSTGGWEALAASGLLYRDVVPSLAAIGRALGRVLGKR